MRIALALVASVVAAPALADDTAPPTVEASTSAPGATPPVESAPDEPEARPSNDMLVPTRARPVADIVVTSRPDRPRKTTLGLAAGAAAGVILGGVGLYYHLDSRDATQELSSHKPTGETWTAERQATYDRAHSSATTAAVFYSVGGAVLIGTAVAYILTEPKEETTIIHPHVSTPVVAPTQGGAIVGGMWSF